MTLSTPPIDRAGQPPARLLHQLVAIFILGFFVTSLGLPLFLKWAQLGLVRRPRKPKGNRPVPLPEFADEQVQWQDNPCGNSRNLVGSKQTER